MRHDAAILWAHRNCVIPDARNELIAHFDSASKRELNCSAIVGLALTQGRKPYLVYCMSGEFFLFELTPEQSRRLEVEENMLVRITGHRCEVRTAWTPMVFIDNVSINQRTELCRDQSITGVLSFRMTTSHAYPLIVRLTYDTPSGGWVSCWHEHPFVSMQGEINFNFPSFQAATDGNDSNFTGPLALFVQLTARIWPDDPDWRMPVSDIRGVLADVRSG